MESAPSCWISWWCSFPRLCRFNWNSLRGKLHRHRYKNISYSDNYPDPSNAYIDRKFTMYVLLRCRNTVHWIITHNWYLMSLFISKWRWSNTSFVLKGRSEKLRMCVYVCASFVSNSFNLMIQSVSQGTWYSDHFCHI